MPATKEQPNLKLIHHFPDVAGGQSSGAVVPAHCVSDPDALVGLGAAAWTGEPVTVKVEPPVAKGLDVATANKIQDRIDGLEDERDDWAAKARKHVAEKAATEAKLNETAADLAAARAHAEEVADAKLKLEDEHKRIAAEKAAADKELADLKASIAAAKSLKDAQAAVK